MMAKFEKVSKFADVDIAVPVRATAHSAGYDFVAAEDIIIPSFITRHDKVYYINAINKCPWDSEIPRNLDTAAFETKDGDIRPTLVSTGMKCKLASDEYLQLSVRSSSPLKYLLIMANGVGIIDSDYYNNPDNEGEIFFQLLNFAPFDIQIKKGDKIGQGIIMKYITTEDDDANGERTGGFGSTNK